MGGRLWFFGDAYSSYTCTGSTLGVMHYGLAKAKELSNELTARMLLIPRIIALGLSLQQFYTKIPANCINMTVRGFGKSFGEQTWRKQIGETLWRYMEIGEYLEKY